MLSGVVSVVYLFQLGHFAPALLGPALTLLLLSLGHTACSTLQQVGVTRRRLKAGARLNGVIYALLTGIQKIKLAGAEKRAFARWADAYADVGTLDFAPPMYLRLTEPISLLISGAGAVWLSWKAGRVGLDVADYLAFHVAFGAVAGALQSWSGIAGLVAQVKPILEINPHHPAVQRLKYETARFDDWAALLFEQAQLAEGGQLDDPAGFVRRMNELMLALSAK